MARNMEGAPVQEEQEQQDINQQVEGNDSKREPTLQERIVEAEKELDKFVQEHPTVTMGTKNDEKNRYLAGRLETLRGQETARLDAERMKAESEREKQKIEIAKAKKELVIYLMFRTNTVIY